MFDDVVQRGGDVADVMVAFRRFLGTGTTGNDMLAYLTMMAPRLVELHRVLKPTGSLYLHVRKASTKKPPTTKRR